MRRLQLMAVLAAAVVGLAAGEPAPLCVCFAATVRVRARPPPRLPCLCASAGSATRKHSTPPARLPPQSQRPRGSPAPAGALTRTRLRTRRHVHPDLRRRMGSTELFCYGRRGLGRSQGLPRDEKSQAQHVRRLPGVLPVLLHPSANVARVPLRSVGRVATCCSVCAPCRALRGEASCDGAQSSLERRGRPCLRAVRMCASYSDAGDPPMRRHPRALARPNRPDRLHPRTQALATDAAKAAKEGVEQTYKGITNSTCETGMAKEWCQVRARALSLSVFTHTYAYTAHTGGVSVAELKLRKQKTCAHIQRTQAEYLLQQRARASVGQAPAHACTHARARARRRR